MNFATRGALLEFALAVGMLVLLPACGPRGTAEAQPAKGPSDNAERTPAEQQPTAEAARRAGTLGGTEAKADGDAQAREVSIDEVFSTATQCEHRVPQYTCPESRASRSFQS